MTSDAQTAESTDDLDGTLVVEEPRFALVPEWVIDAAIPDAAFRLYSLLLRYGNGSGSRMPSRSTLARRLRRSVDAVDRAMRQLSDAGIVRIEHRRAGEQFLSNRYHVRTSPPAPAPTEGGSRVSAATPESGPGGGRTSAARVAADVRPDREILTDTPPPPTPSTTGQAATAVEEADRQLLLRCGIADLDGFAAKCIASRQALGRPTARWTARCLAVVIRLAVIGKGWPADGVQAALLAVAGDPETRSPARVAEAGPWWDATVLGADLRIDAGELADLEWRLSETGGLRPLLQAQARTELAGECLPVTRGTVAQRACSILDRRHTHSTPEAEIPSTSLQAFEGIAR